ncbi:MAG: zinc ribbon domain-containing protein [Methanobrevibacter sp.]|jgi:hypothetical protein|nr:zinc ribbon domain-containing protein [Candidatus Methanoflexus mossambicus]
MSKFCNHCGTENMDNTEFCTKCGNKMPKIFRDGLKNKNILKIGIIAGIILQTLLLITPISFINIIICIVGIVFTLKNNIQAGIICSFIGCFMGLMTPLFFFGMFRFVEIHIISVILFIIYFIGLYYSQKNYKLGGIMIILSSLVITTISLYSYSFIYYLSYVLYFFNLDYYGLDFFILLVMGVMLVCGILTFKNVEKIPILNK